MNTFVVQDEQSNQTRFYLSCWLLMLWFWGTPEEIHFIYTILYNTLYTRVSRKSAKSQRAARQLCKTSVASLERELGACQVPGHGDPEQKNKLKKGPHTSTCIAKHSWLLSKLVTQPGNLGKSRRNVFIDESNTLINRYRSHCRKMDHRLQTSMHTHKRAHTSWWKALLLILSSPPLIFNCSPSPRGKKK